MIIPVETRARNTIECGQRMRGLGIGYVDCTMVSIVSSEPFDEGFGSLEAIFNICQVPESRFLLVIRQRENLATWR